MMEPYNEELLSGSFESMSIGTQFSDSLNEANVYPPHVMSYGQPSTSIDEEYVTLFPFQTNAIPSSISDGMRIWH